jgi:hypothetical protein
MSCISPWPRSLARLCISFTLLSISSACDLQHSSHRIGSGADAGSDRSPRRDAGGAPDVEPPPVADLGDEDPDYLFDPTQVRTFELRLLEEDLAFLDSDPKAEEYVPGELWFEGKRIKPVGIRYKGSTGSFVGCLSGSYYPPTGKKTCPKLGMKIKIDYGDPDAKFYGQKKLLFHAMNSDRSLMRERLGYGLYREMGVHTARTAHMRLLINGELSGVYLLVEEIDGRFTRSRFDDGGKGNLYKEVWPVMDDPARYLGGLETNRDEDPSADKIHAFARALLAADDSTLPSVVEHWMDTDYAARFVAVDRTIRHDDGPFRWYCQPVEPGGNDWHSQRPFGDNLECGNHNYFWYEDTSRERLWPVPWDLDNSMANRPGLPTIRTRWDDLSYSCETLVPSVIGGGQLPLTCDPLQRAWALGLAEPIRAATRELLAGPMSESAVDAKLQEWTEQIAPFVEEANEHFSREPSLAAWRAELTSLRTTLSRLRAEAIVSPMVPDAGVTDSAVPDERDPEANAPDTGE